MAHDGTSHPPEEPAAAAAATTTPPAKPKTAAESRKSAPPPNNSSDAPTPISFCEHGFASSNPQFRPKAYKPVRRSDTSMLGATRNLCNASYRDDYSEGITRYIATVLRVENRNNEQEGDTTAFGWFDSLKMTLSGNPADANILPPVEITAIVDCDVMSAAWGKTGVCHPNFSLPNEAGQGGSTKIIDKIRDAFHGLFIGQSTSTEVPLPGDAVWVAWADANRRDGIYLGPLVSRLPLVGGKFDPRKAFPCNNGLQGGQIGGGGPNTGNSDTTNRTGGSVRRESIDSKKERGRLPYGKGVFTGFPDLKTHDVKSAEQATLSWICCTGIIQNPGSSPKLASSAKIKNFVSAYHKRGMRTYIMGYPRAGSEDTFISHLINIASKAAAIGVIVNMDHYTETAVKLSASAIQKNASYLMDTLKETASKKGFCVGMTATDIVNRADIPWTIFVPTKEQIGVDFVIPQVFVQSATRTKESFIKQFFPWKVLGYKHIIPGLGMIGNSPSPNGWLADEYNTKEKSPYRMREDATWAFNRKDPDSVVRQLGEEAVGMANAAIWWNWEGANITAPHWPEKRWDIIRELGDAGAAAEKLNSLIEASAVEREKIKGLPLGDFMKRNGISAGSEQKAKKQPAEPPAAPPASTDPSSAVAAAKVKADSEKTAADDAAAKKTTTSKTEAEKEALKKKIDEEQLNFKAEEKVLNQFKLDLQKAETSGNDAQKTEAAAQIKKQLEKVNLKKSEIEKLRADLAAADPAGSDTETPPAKKLPCPPGQAGDTTGPAVTLGEAVIREQQIKGIPFEDYGLSFSGPLKTTSYITIHESATTTAKSALRVLKARGLSVHFTVNTFGGIRQHGDLGVGAKHAGSLLNKNGISVEVINKSKFGAPSKQYVPGSANQMEGVWRIVKRISAATNIPISFSNGSSSNFNWKKVTITPGIIPHGSSPSTSHSDGRFPTLYMVLRNEGNTKTKAYKKALEILNKKTGVEYAGLEKISSEAPEEETEGSGWG